MLFSFKPGVSQESRVTPGLPLDSRTGHKLVKSITPAGKLFQTFFVRCDKNVDLTAGGCNIDGEDDSWDFGTGAGFYVDATEEKWKAHYRMYTYITKEVATVP